MHEQLAYVASNGKEGLAIMRSRASPAGSFRLRGINRTKFDIAVKRE